MDYGPQKEQVRLPLYGPCLCLALAQIVIYISLESLSILSALLQPKLGVLLALLDIFPPKFRKLMPIAMALSFNLPCKETIKALLDAQTTLGTQFFTTSLLIVNGSPQSTSYQLHRLLSSNVSFYLTTYGGGLHDQWVIKGFPKDIITPNGKDKKT